MLPNLVNFDSNIFQIVIHRSKNVGMAIYIALSYLQDEKKQQFLQYHTLLFHLFSKPLLAHVPKHLTTHIQIT